MIHHFLSIFVFYAVSGSVVYVLSQKVHTISGDIHEKQQRNVIFHSKNNTKRSNSNQKHTDMYHAPKPAKNIGKSVAGILHH
jgi:hypothetical protein